MPAQTAAQTAAPTPTPTPTPAPVAGQTAAVAHAVAPPEGREMWRSPAGIGALASVAGVLVALLAIFVGSGGGQGSPASLGSQQPGAASVGAVASLAPQTAQMYFVYGTTMPGHYRYDLIEEFVAEAVPDRATGRLYDTGAGYPAAVFGGGLTWIEGYRLEIRSGREFEALRAFTAMESGLFQPVTIRTQAGATVTAFEWIGDVDGFEELKGRWNRPEQ